MATRKSFGSIMSWKCEGVSQVAKARELKSFRPCIVYTVFHSSNSSPLSDTIKAFHKVLRKFPE